MSDSLRWSLLYILDAGCRSPSDAAIPVPLPTCRKITTGSEPEGRQRVLTETLHEVSAEVVTAARAYARLLPTDRTESQVPARFTDWRRKRADEMSLLTTAAISALTAVFSVTLTFFLYRKRDKINSLRAIKSETEQNRETAEIIHRHVSGDMILREEGKERPPSLTPFSTHAFQTAKNAGVLARLPDDVRDTISEYYTLIDTTNHQLEYRQQMRGTSRALSGFSDRMNSLDLHRSGYNSHTKPADTYVVAVTAP